MNKNFYFLSGLPRSGSTLLCNVLMQNPDIYASSTSALSQVLGLIKNTWNQWPANQAMERSIALSRLKYTLRGALMGYYDKVDYPIIIDKSRSWPKMIPMLEEVFDHPVKIIVTVRRIAEILSSLEKLWRKTGSLGITHQEGVKPEMFVRVDARVRAWSGMGGLLGSAVDVIKDAQDCGFADRLLFVDFKDLTHSPKSTLESIYRFLELDPFDHDFNNVIQVTQEDDRFHGWIGLHDIRPKIEPVKPDFKEILGDTISKSLEGQEFW